MDFIIHVVKMVLGHEFLENVNMHYVNMDIMSCFLSSLLELEEDRVEIMLVLRETYKVEYLSDDINVVSHAILGVGITWAGEILNLLKLG